MKNRLVFICGFTTIFVISLFFSADLFAQSQAKKDLKKRASETVIFAIENNNAYGTLLIEPVVIIDRGRFIQPIGFDVEEDNVKYQKFVSNYYKKGTSYPLLFGGSKLGTATIDEQIDAGCSTIAKVQLKTSINVEGETRILATTSQAVGVKKSFRRGVDQSEKSAMLLLAEKIYQEKGVPKDQVKNISTVSLDAIDFNGDGKAELVGSFTIGEEVTEKSPILFRLFIVAERQNITYKASLSLYNEAPESGTDIWQRLFVDQKDLDGDGIKELIIKDIYTSRNTGYLIYKKKHGQWIQIYHGGGSGC
jgi:hypothetical protein